MPSTPPPPPVAIGELVANKYRVERVLGRGGMGVVVAAMHEQLAQRVAIKMLLPEAKASPQALARFAREARTAATIRGEHVARVLDVGELEGGAPYIVMEYLDGRDLAQTLAERGTLPADEAVAFVLQACEAIAEAHAAGIIHRDLKPSNLFVTRGADGSPLVKVLDFGISKRLLCSDAEGQLTTTSSFIGSPLYSPPEQLVRSHDVDARSDIWSLGTILFEVLAGRPPFLGDSVMHVASKIFNEDPAPLTELRSDLPADLCAVVMRCLRRRPEERYPDVRALARALAPFAPAHSDSADRVERIVAASLPPFQVPALADTLASSKMAASGEAHHALVSARTPAATGSRRWIVVATGSALVGATLVAILAFGRTPAQPATGLPVSPASAVPVAATGVMPVPPGSTDSVPAAETSPPAPGPSPSASVSVAAPRLVPPVPPKKSPLSVSVK
jgi:eukaryotic-like serine/threonine-protein kinase